MRGILICSVLALSTGAAIADRPVTQQESEQLEAALKEQGCSGGKMEFDDGKFDVDNAAWPLVYRRRFLEPGHGTTT